MDVKHFFHEFKEFALRGNVMSLAVGMIIGMAFQNLVSSLTDNILSPLIGLFVGQNFDALELHIFGIELRYGLFITSVVNFVILAFVVFLLVKFMNRLLEGHKHKEEAPPPERHCQFCKTVIDKEATRCPACTSNL